MEKELIQKKIDELRSEYKKGVSLVQETQAKILRIEGAIIKLEELLSELKEGKEEPALIS